MKPVLAALVAMVIYAFCNLMVDEKLKQCNTFALLVCWYGAFLPVAIVRLGWLKISSQPLGFPEGKLLLLACIMGMLFFIADFAYISSYTVFGGRLMTVTSMVIMFPVAASIWKKLIYGGWPNMYEVASYFAAVLAALLATKGTSQ